MSQEDVLLDQTVLIEDGLVTAMGPASDTAIPDCFSVIEGDGAYLMPGLADMHVHIYEESLTDWPVSPMLLNLAHGVTTIRDAGANPRQGGQDGSFVLELRSQIEAGEVIGPSIITPGLIVKGNRPPTVEISSRLSVGFDYIKSYSELFPGDFSELMRLSEENGLYNYGHIPWLMDLPTAIEAGLEEIAHIEEIGYGLMLEAASPEQMPDQDEWVALILSSLQMIEGYEEGFNQAGFESLYGERLDEYLKVMQEYSTSVTTTLWLGPIVEEKLHDVESFLQRTEAVYMPAEYLDEVRTGTEKHQLIYNSIGTMYADWAMDYNLYLFQRLRQAGINLVLGTDAGSGNMGLVSGFAVIDELQYMTELGATPYEALTTATVNAAMVVERMTGQGNFGAIEEGNRADLILVAENPLEDSSVLWDVLGVMAAGRWYDADQINEWLAIPASEGDSMSAVQ
jgi:hypothetical protein